MRAHKSHTKTADSAEKMRKVAKIYQMLVVKEKVVESVGLAVFLQANSFEKQFYFKVNSVVSI